MNDNAIEMIHFLRNLGYENTVLDNAKMGLENSFCFYFNTNKKLKAADLFHSELIAGYFRNYVDKKSYEFITINLNIAVDILYFCISRYTKISELEKFADFFRNLDEILIRELSKLNFDDETKGVDDENR